MLKRKLRRLVRTVKARLEEIGDRVTASLRPQPRLVPIPVRVRPRR